MKQIFRPKSMVVIGVSSKITNFGKNALSNTLALSYSGKLYAVGREEGNIYGSPIYKSVLDLPEVPDLAVLILPKQHLESSEKLPSTAFTLAKKIAKKLKSKFKPKDVTIVSSNIMGHEAINVFPIYENETLESPRQQTPSEELEKLQKLLEKKSKPKQSKKTKKVKSEKKLWLPIRIP